LPIRKFFIDPDAITNDQSASVAYASELGAALFGGTIVSVDLFSPNGGEGKVAIFENDAGSPGAKLAENLTGATLTSGVWNRLDVAPFLVNASDELWVETIGDVVGAIGRTSTDTASRKTYYRTNSTYASYSPNDPWGETPDGTLQPVLTGARIYGWIPPTISDVSTEKLYLGVPATISGVDFMGDQGAVGKVEVCDNSDYAIGTKYALTPTAWADGEITVSGHSGEIPSGTYYLFVTTDLGQRNETGFEIQVSNPPVLANIDPSSIKNSQLFTITGSDLMVTGATVEVCDNSDYGLANKYGLTIVSESDSEIAAVMDNEGAFYGSGWIVVTNGDTQRSDPYMVTILESIPYVFSSGDFVGYGHQPFGRHCFGGMKTDFEPRFIDSTPSDGSTGVSVLFVAANTEIYCFSSRIQDIHVEVSEDGGDFVDAYVNGAFVSPYDASDSFVDFHQADPQKTIVKIEKSIPWEENIEVVIRVTATDQFGNEATEELPVIW
jgi:hypothetical protein